MQDRRTADRAAVGAPERIEADCADIDSQERRRRQRFARALARSAFGRNYWDDRLEAELQGQLRISKQRRQR